MKSLAIALLPLSCSQAPGDCHVFGDIDGVPVPEHLRAELVVDDAFAAVQVRAIERAAGEWARATEGRAMLTLTPGDATREWAIDSVGAIPECSRCAGLTSLGTHRLELNQSRIDGAEMFYGVVLHELGHFFGLGHSADESALMFGCYVGNDQITASDVEAFDDLY